VLNFFLHVLISTSEIFRKILSKKFSLVLNFLFFTCVKFFFLYVLIFYNRDFSQNFQPKIQPGLFFFTGLNFLLPRFFAKFSAKNLARSYFFFFTCVKFFTTRLFRIILSPQFSQVLIFFFYMSLFSTTKIFRKIFSPKSNLFSLYRILADNFIT